MSRGWAFPWGAKSAHYYDEDGEYIGGFDRGGFDRMGFDEDGFDREGFDRWGYDEDDVPF